MFNVGDTYFSLFKNIVETKSLDLTNQIETSYSRITETVHKIPTFKYNADFSSKEFDLSNHYTIFEPSDSTSYKVKVRENFSCLLSIMKIILIIVNLMED